MNELPEVFGIEPLQSVDVYQKKNNIDNVL